MEFLFFILFICIFFIIIISSQKKAFLNTFNEVLTGDVLSYYCQDTGITVDTKNRTVTIFTSERKSTYSYSEIKGVNYSLSEAGKVYATSNTISSMTKAAQANNIEKARANQRSGIFVLTDDIMNPSWKINLPMTNKTSSSTQQICDRWILIFEKYVFQ